MWMKNILEAHKCYQPRPGFQGSGRVLVTTGLCALKWAIQVNCFHILLFHHTEQNSLKLKCCLFYVFFSLILTIWVSRTSYKSDNPCNIKIITATTHWILNVCHTPCGGPYNNPMTGAPLNILSLLIKKLRAKEAKRLAPDHIATWVQWKY